MRMSLTSTPRSILCCLSTPCSQSVFRTRPSLTNLLPGFRCLGGCLSHWSCPAVYIIFWAPALKARALARCQPTDDPVADQTLFDTTLTELQQGWLDGPFLVPDVPKTSVISPRFYVLQSDKCRPIDDFTFNLLNSAVGSANKVVLHDTDFIAALLKRCCGYTEVPWRGRAFDLQDAYRQLAIAPAHRAHSFICVRAAAWPAVLPYADHALWQLGLCLRLFAH